MEEWINPVTIGAITGILTAIGGAIGFLIKHFTSAPIARKEAEVAASSAITDANKASVDTVVIVMGELRKENERLTKEISAIRAIESMWDEWYNNLVKKWAEIRVALVPPDAPELEDK